MVDTGLNWRAPAIDEALVGLVAVPPEKSGLALCLRYFGCRNLVAVRQLHRYGSTQLVDGNSI